MYTILLTRLLLITLWQLFGPVAAVVKCPERKERIRYDIGDFTPEEFKCWESAQRRLWRNGIFNKIQVEHGMIGPPGHKGDILFLEAHRWLLLDWEDALIESADKPECCLPGSPYYDLGRRTEAWENNRTVLFTDDRIGVCPDELACVTGTFRDLSFSHRDEGKRCVMRNCEDLHKMIPAHRMEERIGRSISWNMTGKAIFQGNHIRAHVAVGGHMGVCAESARDVFFWLVHTYVDRDFTHWYNPPNHPELAAFRSHMDHQTLAMKIPFYEKTIAEVDARQKKANIRYVMPGEREGVTNWDPLEPLGNDDHLSQEQIDKEDAEGAPTAEELEILKHGHPSKTTGELQTPPAGESESTKKEAPQGQKNPNQPVLHNPNAGMQVAPYIFADIWIVLLLIFFTQRA